MTPADTTRLIDAYCAAWSGTDTEARLAAVLTPGATYTDPTVQVTGPAGLAAHIVAVLAQYPGASIRRTTEVELHHDRGRFGWRMVLGDGTALPDGQDIVAIDPESGKLAWVLGFFGAPRPAG